VHSPLECTHINQPEELQMTLEKDLYPFQYNFIGMYGNEETLVIHAESSTKANELFEQFFPYATEVELVKDFA
jgi:hypothetical protein